MLGPAPPARAAATTERLLEQASHLLGRWNEATAGLRADHTARALLRHLPGSPVLSAGDVAALLGVSERSGRAALASLAACGILAPIADVPPARAGRTRHGFAATELLDMWAP